MFFAAKSLSSQLTRIHATRCLWDTWELTAVCSITRRTSVDEAANLPAASAISSTSSAVAATTQFHRHRSITAASSTPRPLYPAVRALECRRSPRTRLHADHSPSKLTARPAAAATALRHLRSSQHTRQRARRAVAR